jgi:hypothetical protein
LLKTVVQVARFEVMGNTGDLLTRHVVQVGPHLAGLVDHLLQLGGLAIVQDDDTELVLGIVLVTGSTSGIHDQIIVLLATGDEDIDGGHVVVTHQPEPGAVSGLESKHGPSIVHEVGNGDEEFDGEEDPGRTNVDLGGALHIDGAVETEGQVGEVEDHVDENQEGGQEVGIALDALPLLGIVTIVQTHNGSGALGIGGEGGEAMIVLGGITAQTGLTHTHLTVAM